MLSLPKLLLQIVSAIVELFLLLHEPVEIMTTPEPQIYNFCTLLLHPLI